MTAISRSLGGTAGLLAWPKDRLLRLILLSHHPDARLCTQP